jgi:hypothetical protein
MSELTFNAKGAFARVAGTTSATPNTAVKAAGLQASRRSLLFANCGTDTIYLGINEAPTASAWEYKVPVGATIPLAIAGPVSLYTLSPSPSQAFSVKEFA